MPSCEEEALAINRTVINQGPTLYERREAAGIDGPTGSHMGAAWVVARSLGMVALAAFGILVLMPAAIAAQTALAL
jgi:hypothetical protein